MTTTLPAAAASEQETKRPADCAPTSHEGDAIALAYRVLKVCSLAAALKVAAS